MEQETNAAQTQASMSAQNSAPIPKAIIATIIISLTTIFGVWVWLEGISKFDPMLWYLNWQPGVFGLYSFAGGFVSRAIFFTALIVGIAISITRSSPMPSIVGAILGIFLMTLLADNGVGRYFAFQTGMAQVECYQPASKGCLLNDYARMYDLGWTRVMTRQEEAQYSAYEALRARAKMEKPGDSLNAYQLGQHQIELRKWETRFQPELDALLLRQVN